MTTSANVIEMKLRDWYRLPEDMVLECGSAFRRVLLLESEVATLRRRIEYLEQHVPEEIAKPKVAEPRYHKRSQWD